MLQGRAESIIIASNDFLGMSFKLQHQLHLRRFCVTYQSVDLSVNLVFYKYKWLTGKQQHVYLVILAKI